MKQLFAFAVILGLLSATCKKDDSESNLNNADYIEYGSSFGMCVGYCKGSIKLTSEKKICSKSSWGNLKPVTSISNFSTEDWLNILNKINLDTFYSLDSIYGCPDCADGGAEWVEIKTGEKTHKVFFEYHNEPGALKGILNDLREIQCKW